VAACAAAVVLSAARDARADIILSSQVLNDALKEMQRQRQTRASGAPAERLEALFQLGVLADGLASLLNEEVAAHGAQERALIELAISRTGELGLVIAYDDTKKKFFYDLVAFRHYLEEAPAGPRAAEAEFELIEGEFFRSTGEDAEALAASVERKKRWLARYPSREGSPDVSLFLAIDYRDLYRRFEEAGNASMRNRYRDLTRRQLRATARTYPKTEPGDVAAKMLPRFEEEVKKRSGAQ
jgi:hypothetical protein